MHRVRPLWVFLSTCILCAAAARGPAAESGPYGIALSRDVMVAMRDGVRLATDVYRLEGAGPAPVLVTRTPYNKEFTVAGSKNTFDIGRAVEAGYVVVIQDVRGRYASEGTFAPMIQETDDGLDAFAWAAAQPWSNGIVGTFGGSYLGGTQWLPARAQPPADAAKPDTGKP